MKKLLITLFFAGIITVNAPVIAQGTTTINETSSHSVFKGLFKSVWAHLKSLNPTQKQSARSNQTYLAGIRGAETTETLLKPYWKADLTQDENFQAELERFSLAQYKMDQGDLEAAVVLFDGFLSQYEASDMRPNALFAKSISLANIDQRKQSLAVMRQFVDENPNHPLLADAKQVINLLN
ncbi:MAG: hypothetical protein OER98_05245 [Gammaproteobacteria bacterium]|nr:hypothetical protein [Gammaproteobacteria bacterium]